MEFSEHLRRDMQRRGIGVNYLVQLIHLSYSSIRRRIMDNSFTNVEISYLLIHHFRIRSDKHDKFLEGIKALK